MTYLASERLLPEYMKRRVTTRVCSDELAQGSGDKEDA